MNAGKGRLISEINVTPFVDVMLVLLIIFMVTAPLLTQGLEVDLPQTNTVESLPQEDDHLVLTVRKDGSIFLDEYTIALPELKTKLPKIVKGRLLYLRADKAVPYGTVVQVMSAVKAAGIEKLGVVAEPEDEH